MSILRDNDLCRMLEADLGDKGIDLVDYKRRKITTRKLLVYTIELPGTSRLKKELGRREVGDQVEWGHNEWLTCATANNAASIAYYLQCLLWQNGGGKGEKPEPPEPIMYPGYKPPVPEVATSEEIVQWLGMLGTL